MKTRVYVDIPTEDRIITTLLSKKEIVAKMSKALDTSVHLGVLGAIWTWCGARKRGLDGFPVLYANHNQNKEVTCKSCLRRIKAGTPAPAVQRMMEIAIEEMDRRAKFEKDSRNRTHKQVMSLPLYTVTVKMKATPSGYYERDYDTRYPEAISGQIMGIKLKETGFQGVDDKYIEEAEKSK